MSIRWTKGAVELRQNQDGELYLERATDRSDPNMTFDPEKGELPTLFRTLQQSGFNVKASALVLFGSETHEDSDHPKSLPADVMVDNKKKPGEKYGHAYIAKTVAAFRPVTFDLRLSWYKPQLWVFSTQFKPGGGNGAKRRTLDIKRAEAPTASGAKLKRAE